MRQKKIAAIEWQVRLPNGKLLKGVHTYRKSFQEAVELAALFNDRYLGIIRHKAIITKRNFE